MIVGGLAERHGLELERLDCPQQPKAGFVVVADHIGRHGASVVVDDLGRIGLDHQIADRQHQTVSIDEDARSFAFAPEALDGAAFGIDVGLDPHHRRNELFDPGILRRDL